MTPPLGRGRKLEALRRVIEDMDEGLIARHTAMARVRVLTYYDMFGGVPGLADATDVTWLHGDSSVMAPFPRQVPVPPEDPPDPR